MLNLALVGPLAHAGLALATSLSAFLNAGLLLVTLLRIGVYKPEPGWPRYFVQVAGASIVLVGLLVWARGSAESWYAADVWARALRLSGLVLLGMTGYLVALRLFGVRPRQLLAR